MGDKKLQSRVGVIGLGKMGSALADALLAKGFEISVWNRTSAKAERLVEAGAKLTLSVADAARNSDALVVCLTDYAAIKAALMTDDVGPILRGKILVDLTSVSSEELRALVEWADANGILLLKGTILTYPDDVRAGEGRIVYGGARRVFDAIAPVLQAMGGSAVHIGDNADDGVKVGLAYGCFLYPALVAFLHGAAVCQRAGIPIETYAHSLIFPVVRGPILSGALERLMKATLARRYDEDVQATLNIWNASLASDIHDMNSYRLDTKLLHAVKTLLDLAVAQGFGEKDLAAVFEVLMIDDR